MALALVNSGTQSATPGTEHTLDTITSGKTLVLVVDVAAMLSGDVLTLRIYTKCLSGGVERLAYEATYANVQGTPIKYSIPVPANISFKAALLQEAGSTRDFPWSILSLD